MHTSTISFSHESLKDSTMLNETMAAPLSTEDRKTRINLLLRQVDSEIKSGNYDHALTLTHQVYSFDRKNLYARAFEERIIELRSSKEYGKKQHESQASPAMRIDTTARKHVATPASIPQHEERQLHIVETREEVLQCSLPEVSTRETQPPFEQPILDFNNDQLDDRLELTEDVEQQLMRKIHSVLESKQLEIEETFERQLRDLEATVKSFPELGTAIPSSSQRAHSNTIMVPLNMKEQQDNQMNDWLLAERKRILEELTQQLKEEQQAFQENLAQHYKSTYEKKLEEETGKAHQQALTAYRSTVATILQYKLPKLVHQAITRTMRTPLLITDEEHEQLEHQAHIDLYTHAILETVTKESPTSADWELLAKQRNLYSISETEHKQLLKQVKRDLNLPDDTAIIFVIDDDPVVLTYTSHILKQIYPNVHTAESAPAAAKLFEEQTPNLIICDVNLPGMGGFAFYENIINGVYGDSVKSTPFIFASSLGDQFIINGAKQLGAKAYLVKPVSKETLENTVKECLV